ncbi:GNAT family N-acetyltransferase [Clostridium hydrogeniformans]|uniref:GNAT family N-acetyltransferase n=1 Tax=Clostridium hydrogeniformans TaxID=349933 RepID=UPI000554DFE0|nr:GNAT family N-acetyltransferase [Clostridium hydrogeniformans]
MNIHFESINPNNWRSFNSLKVKENQKIFVSSNVKIMARAFAYRECNSQVHGIYEGGTPIGVLSQYDLKEGDKLLCVLDQFMISGEHQGKGYGKKVMDLWIDSIKNEGKYELIILCYIKGNEMAKKLYLNIGFYHTEEKDEEEIIMKYNLK